MIVSAGVCRGSCASSDRITRKPAGVHVDEIGPVGVIHAGIQDYQTWRIPTADRAEAALISRAGNEFAQNVIGGIALRAAFVSRIDNKVCGRQC